MSVELSLAEVIEALEQHYGAAGFGDVYNNILKGKSESEIRQMYTEATRPIQLDNDGPPF